MMAFNNNEYKAKLRNRNISQVDLEQEGRIFEESRETNGEVGKNREVGDSGGARDPAPGSVTEQPEVPIVKMTDFKVVDVDDKLNLLMSAINKINTTFHYKFESLQQKLTGQINGITPKLTAVESLNQEIQARLDDLEEKAVKTENLERKYAELERKYAEVQDELAIVKRCATSPRQSYTFKS